MKKIRARIALMAGALALVSGVSVNAFAQSGQHAQHGAASGQAGQHQGMPGHEMMQSMEAMHQKMSSMQMTGDHDHDFAMMMRSHHQAGIDMAKAQLKNGKDPQMQAMAKKVISDQTKEIKKLDQWLSKHQASGK
ncbi:MULTISPECIES: DUF305 domain-containing protein [Massilia]|jgi:uncharacterized protein (DUF305 family)|uniref:DUF305 domain-containing protein n=1 Tax=Massilia timonae TaxID=47229 RepID=A0A1S2N7N1_9BURK|nr:DUF305 domain-containing protein [Massilia timonae]OIJ40820.1 hypothetical protein LO55_4100 [Massilia timonae]